MGAKTCEMLGKTFGGLTVVESAGSIQIGKSKHKAWNCSCNKCRTGTKIVTTYQLRSGNTTSCGCKIKHGWSRTKVYKALQDAILRCTKEDHPSYYLYGARGVTVYEGWMKDKVSFCEYLGNPPDSRKWSVERIDGNKGYWPGNVMWQLPDKQVRNRHKNGNNSSGMTGVTWSTLKNVTRANAWWSVNGKSHGKSFSVKTYGLLPAFAMACAHREKMIKELNAAGAGYSDNHGK